MICPNPEERRGERNFENGKCRAKVFSSGLRFLLSRLHTTLQDYSEVFRPSAENAIVDRTVQYPRVVRKYFLRLSIRNISAIEPKNKHDHKTFWISFLPVQVFVWRFLRAFYYEVDFERGVCQVKGTNAVQLPSHFFFQIVCFCMHSKMAF